MAKYRYIYTNFWEDPKVMDNFTPEDKYFYLYLLTNSHTTQIGVYKLSKKHMVFELGYTEESINSLIFRFVNYHKLIRYNEDTREIAIKNWAKFNLNNSGKPILDLIRKELELVEDISLLQFIAENIPNDAIRTIFIEYMVSKIPTEKNDVLHDTSNTPYNVPSALSGQKENENENKKENNIIYFQPTEQTNESVDNVDNSPLSDDKSSDSVDSKIPYNQIIELFNNSCKSLPQVKARSKQRDKMIKALWKRCGEDINKIKEYFSRVEKSDFLTGRNAVWQNCNFDWLLKESNYIKVFEGNYDNKEKPPEKPPKKGNFNNYEQRTYDFDDLERKLLGWK